MFIICWKSKCLNDDGIQIGYLPFSQIPEDSILRKAIFNDDDLVWIEGSMCAGLHGVHWDRKLAEEHLKLESAWRNNDKLWIKEIKEE